MAWRYSLTKLFPSGQSFRVQHTKDGKVQSTMVRFDFGKVYETSDEVLVKSLERLHGRYPNTSNNKEWLDSVGVETSLVQCPSCGGRVMKLQANYFTIEEV